MNRLVSTDVNGLRFALVINMAPPLGTGRIPVLDHSRSSLRPVPYLGQLP